MHALNVFEFFNTLDETLYDIDEILTYKTLYKGGNEQWDRMNSDVK